MKFLLDQDVYSVTAQFLKSLGHDVITAKDIGLSQASDNDLLLKAKEQNRIFVTRDRDFGNLVFVKGYNSGVVYLRILPSTLESVHKEIKKVLISYSEDELNKAFVVVEHERHRFRKL